MTRVNLTPLPSCDEGVIPEAMETHPSVALTPIAASMQALSVPDPPPIGHTVIEHEPLSGRGRMRISLSLHPNARARIVELHETGLYGLTLTSTVEQLFLRSLRYALGVR